jgi:hypothetical protein
MNRPKVLAVLSLALVLLTAGCANCPFHRLLFGTEEKGGQEQSSVPSPDAAVAPQTMPPATGTE